MSSYLSLIDQLAMPFAMAPVAHRLHVPGRIEGTPDRIRLVVILCWRRRSAVLAPSVGALKHHPPHRPKKPVLAILFIADVMRHQNSSGCPLRYLSRNSAAV